VHAIALLYCASGCGRIGFESTELEVEDGGETMTDANSDGSTDATSVDATSIDGSPIDAANVTTLVAELLDDTAGDELEPDWWFNELQSLTSLTGDSRWLFSCSGGGSPAGSWTVDITKANVDACVAVIVNGPAQDYPVQYVSGPTLTNPTLRCGSNKQVSLRADEGEMFTLFPPNTNSLEGQWCNGVVSSGTSPSSSHRLEITSL
jgi:hypothetical protein